MTGETDNTEINNQSTAATSIKDSWIICNSKTRPGFKYYFNTCTGDSTWKLSIAEIEKAKKITKTLPIAEIDNCPEPIYPPMEPSQNNLPVFNNQMPNMFPLNMMNAIPGGSNFNPNVWTTAPANAGLPPGPIVYLAFPNPMNLQPPQEYLQNVSTNYQQLYGSQHSDEFAHNYNRNINNDRYNSESNNNRGSRQNNWGRNRCLYRNTQHQVNMLGRNPDLRQKLMRKRSMSQSSEPVVHNENIHQEDRELPVINLQEETPSKYDLSPMKQLKPPYSKAINWLIVVDTEIITNNFPFLNKITDPDQNCYLMVPDHVMRELRTFAFVDNDPLIKRIYRFLSEQINNELAFRGEIIVNSQCNDDDKLYRTCLDQTNDNNVILLTNNKNLHENKNNENDIHILSLNELKSLLNNRPAKQVPVGKISPTMAIKITVPNVRETESRSVENFKSTRLRSKTPDIEITPHVAKNFIISDQTDSYNARPLRSITPDIGIMHHFANKRTSAQTNPYNATRTTRSKTPDFGIMHHVANKGISAQTNPYNVTRSLSSKTPDTGMMQHVANKEISAQTHLNPSNPTRTLRSNTPDVGITQHVANEQTNSPWPAPTSSRRILNTSVPVWSSNFSNIDEVDSVQKLRSFSGAKESIDSLKLNLPVTSDCSAQKPNEGNSQPRKYRWRKQRTRCSSTDIHSKQSSDTKQVAAGNISSENNNTPSIMHISENMDIIVNADQAYPKPVEIVPQVTPIISPFRAPSLDRSSVSSQPKRSARPNIVIEETSTSGITSNANTNDSESTNSTKERKPLMIDFEHFKLAGPGMSEVLKSRREEWVLRFVQVMEEVLREKLRENSPFQSKDYAEPWATDLPELTRCIIEKYSRYCSIVDAANRLSFTLYRISDDKGHVSANIEPAQYMDMYSYGVYLITAIKEVDSDCEDLKAANESLKKLLYDIQNANLETGHNFTFVDEMNDTAPNPVEPMDVDEELSRPYPDGDYFKTSRKDDRSNRESSENSYQFRPRQRKTSQETFAETPKSGTVAIIPSRTSLSPRILQSPKAPQSPKSPHSPKITLFSKILQLQENPLSPKNPQSPKILLSPKIQQSQTYQLSPKKLQPLIIPQSPTTTPQSSNASSSPNILYSPKTPSPITPSSPIPQSQTALEYSNNLQNPLEKQIEPEAVAKLNTLNDNQVAINDVSDQNKSAVQPVIVRNFTSIDQFEKKLLNRNFTNQEDENYVDDEEYQDDDAYQDDYDDTEYPDDYYEDGVEDDQPREKHQVELEEGEIGEDEDRLCEPLNVESHDKSNDFFGSVRKTMDDVGSLCVNLVEELKNHPVVSPKKRNELCEAHASVLKISSLLNRIVEKNTMPENDLMQRKEALSNDKRLKYVDDVIVYRDEALNYYKLLGQIMEVADMNA